MSDISFDLDGVRVNVRVACILRHGDSVLLCQTVGESWWFTPGGRVRAGESFEEAIDRELKEEIGLPVLLGPCIAIAEGFFYNDGRNFHEVGAYFTASLKADPREIPTRFENEEREWVAVEQTRDMEIYPEFLRSMIADPPSSLRLHTFRESQ